MSNHTKPELREPIGYLDIDAAEIRRANYETASWYTIFEHEAQTVAVYRSGDNRYTWAIEGVTTYEFFPSSFGGVMTGGGTIGECEKPGVHHVTVYDYTAADMLLAGAIRPEPGITIETTRHDHPVSCMGYVADYTLPVGDPGRYAACECPHHVDGMGRIEDNRNNRGHLAFGYVPGVTETKFHHRIVKAA